MLKKCKFEFKVTLVLVEVETQKSVYAAEMTVYPDTYSLNDWLVQNAYALKETFINFLDYEYKEGLIFCKYVIEFRFKTDDVTKFLDDAMINSAFGINVFRSSAAVPEIDGDKLAAALEKQKEVDKMIDKQIEEEIAEDLKKFEESGELPPWADSLFEGSDMRAAEKTTRGENMVDDPDEWRPPTFGDDLIDENDPRLAEILENEKKLNGGENSVKR